MVEETVFLAIEKVVTTDLPMANLINLTIKQNPKSPKIDFLREPTKNYSLNIPYKREEKGSSN